MVTLKDLTTLLKECDTATGKHHSLKTGRFGYHLVVDNTEVIPPSAHMEVYYYNVEQYLIEQRAKQWEAIEEPPLT
jgi:hypothetical protein